MVAFCESPVWDQLCREWNVPPEAGVKGLVTVIEGLSQSQPAQMALEAPEPAPAGVVLVFEDEVPLDEPQKVIEGEAQVRATRKRPNRTGASGG